jgi:uncharacterized protein (DUF362 family)/ferredoxin
MFRFDVIKANTFKEVKNGIKDLLLRKYIDIFPSGRNAHILIKPNLNSNMNALTGNTTDLRLLAAVVEFLKERGYRNIIIGEGTNSGFYRNKISVIERLGIDKLAQFYGIFVKDLNYSDPVEIEFESGVKASVAKECMEADLFINMPKLKTHFEAGMSVCLKNLMGCLVGQENKKKTHQSLAANIIHINQNIKPHLHIVDAMISMEGLGPTRGIPIRTDMILVGEDPYMIDLMCARVASIDYRKVSPLLEAEKRGIINRRYHRFVNHFQLGDIFHFKPPKPGYLAGFIHHPKRQKYFLAIRNTLLFDYICSTRAGGRLLYLTGLRQDVFIEEEMECEYLSLNEEKCSRCGKCADYCPIELPLPDALPHGRDPKRMDGSMSHCILCMYCFCICPEYAIEYHGELGFMKEQLKQYDDLVRSIG